MMRIFLSLLVWFVSLNCFAQTERKFIRKGNKEFSEEKYEDAEILYRKAIEEDPKSDKANYNLSNSLYKQDKFEASSSRYENLIVDEEQDNFKLANYYYNLGNSVN